MPIGCNGTVTCELVVFVPPLPPPVAAPPALAESNDKPVDKLAIFVTGNLKKTLLLKKNTLSVINVHVINVHN